MSRLPGGKIHINVSLSLAQAHCTQHLQGESQIGGRFHQYLTFPQHYTLSKYEDDICGLLGLKWTTFWIYLPT